VSPDCRHREKTDGDKEVAAAARKAPEVFVDP